MKIRYYDRAAKQTVRLDVPSDVVCITLPHSDGHPELEVNVHIDAILLDQVEGKMVVTRWDLDEVYADFVNARK
jgi:hypothetical protein